MKAPQKANIIKASRILQNKVGVVAIPKDKIMQAQAEIEQNEIDFIPMANNYLESLENAIIKARHGSGTQDEKRQDIAKYVMEMKANGAMFNYPLVGRLANIMLHFLEHIQTVDKNVLEIVDAHHKTLRVIILKKITGYGGQRGRKLEQELKNACERYFAKQKP